MSPTGPVHPEGRIVLLVGDPGSGKTGICRQVADAARHKGLRVAGLLTEACRLASGRHVQTVVKLRTGERRRLADYVGTEDGEPIGRDIAGRLSWLFIGESLRWGRHELERCQSGVVDLFVLDQLGPLELVAGSGWVNGVDVLATERFATALVVVNPLVLPELRRRIGGHGVIEVAVNEATRDLLPEYLGALMGSGPSSCPPLIALGGADMVVADLDGTLVSSTGDPLAGEVAAGLREVAAAGSTFVVCTGRPTEFARGAVRALGAERGYVIAYGGAETSVLADGSVLDQVHLTSRAVDEVLAVARETGLEVDSHDSPVGVLRLVLTGDERQIEQAAVLIAQALPGIALVQRPQAGVLAVQHAAATKLSALTALAEHLEVDRGFVAYLGDAADDASALRWAGLGIAVAGDSPEAAEAGDMVVSRTQVPRVLVRLALARRFREAC
jgi:HAD superfamily hydrolase (TIGR01484 family)